MFSTTIFWMLVSNNRYLLNIIILISLASLYHVSISINNLEDCKLLYNSYSSYDSLTITIIIIAIIIAIWVISEYSSNVLKIGNKINNEFITLIMLLMISLISLSSSNNFLTLFVAIELQSLTLYILLATNIYPMILNNSSKVSLSYLINAALATGLLLYGMSLNSNYLILLGVLWKLGIIPVHIWSLPVLDNQNSLIVSIFLTLSKFGILLIIGLLASSNTISIEILSFIGFINLLLGNILGLLQTRYQRIIVYSSMIQIGYILMIISSNTSIGITYFEIYSFYTIILLLLWIVPTYNIFNSAKLFPSILLFIMIITLYTVAGLPFFPLFWTKLDILLVINSQSLIIALVSTLLSSLIYIRLIKYMAFFKYNQ